MPDPRGRRRGRVENSGDGASRGRPSERTEDGAPGNRSSEDDERIAADNVAVVRAMSRRWDASTALTVATVVPQIALRHVSTEAATREALRHILVAREKTGSR